jgi:hypothetical protein
MDKIEDVSRELTDYMIKNVFTSRKLCQDCRYFLFYSSLKMECINSDSPKFDINIGKFDSCPLWEKRIDD